MDGVVGSAAALAARADLLRAGVRAVRDHRRVYLQHGTVRDTVKLEGRIFKKIIINISDLFLKIRFLLAVDLGAFHQRNFGQIFPGPH